MNNRSIGALAAASSMLLAAVASTSQAQQSTEAARPRVCVVTPDVQLGQGVSDSGNAAAPVKASLIKYLSGPAAVIIGLQSRVAVQISAEAAQHQCAYILDAAVTQKKAGKGMKGLLAAMPALVSAVPYVGGSGMEGYAAASVASAAVEGMAMAQQDDDQLDVMAAMTGVAQGNIKKGDEIELKYELLRAGSATPVKSASLKAKAKENGQDILSPLIEQAATQVLTAALSPGS